jgi:hypothetical protein
MQIRLILIVSSSSFLESVSFAASSQSFLIFFSKTVIRHIGLRKVFS